MRKVFFIVSSLLCLLLCACAQKHTEEYTKTIFAMDTVMDFRIYSDRGDAVLTEAEDEIKQLETLFDRGDKSGEVYRINKGQTIILSADTAAVIRDALRISKETDGAFDITIAPVMDLWGFYGAEYHVPSEQELQPVLNCVGYEKIRLEGDRISLPKGSAIDLGGIGKGYASDRAAALMKQRGVKSGILSLGGNVYTIGTKPDGSMWTVGITDPDNRTQTIGKIKVRDQAVVTSGNYQRYFEKDGVVYHHIMDSKTGTCARSGLSSVTIIADSGAEADGLSTALFVMGLEKSIRFWHDKHNFEAIFVAENGGVYVTAGIADTFESNRDFNVIK